MPHPDTGNSGGTPDGTSDAATDGNVAYGRKPFKRSRSHFADRITADGRDGWPVEAAATGWWPAVPARGRAAP